VPRFTLFTRNVDGLHQKAGASLCWKFTAASEIFVAHGANARGSIGAFRLPPSCECGALARPGVVWFGEGLPREIWLSAERATFSCDVLLVVGTSAVVYPAAGLGDLAQSSGAKVIEINAEATTISRTVDCALTGPAGEILPKLIDPAAESAEHGGI
jgi:NAD-dependent deacetylase